MNARFLVIGQACYVLMAPLNVIQITLSAGFRKHVLPVPGAVARGRPEGGGAEPRTRMRGSIRGARRGVGRHSMGPDSVRWTDVL